MHVINDEACLYSLHYESTPDREQQMEDYQRLQAKNLKRLQRDWRLGVHLPKKYYSYQDALIRMLAKFQTIWDGYFGRVRDAKHCTDLTNKDVPWLTPRHIVPVQQSVRLLLSKLTGWFLKKLQMQPAQNRRHQLSLR